LREEALVYTSYPLGLENGALALITTSFNFKAASKGEFYPTLSEKCLPVYKSGAESLQFIFEICPLTEGVILQNDHN
jgi:hypothetical protein